MCFSVQQVKGFPFQTQIWEDNCNRPTTWLFRPDAILDKASCTEDVQLSGRQSTLSGRSDLITKSGRSPIQERISVNLKSRLHSCSFGRRLEEIVPDPI